MLISIVIPAYKTLFLKKTINSVLNQTFRDFELIIVDDCSPHDIESIIIEYHDSRIRYYRNSKNCGAINVVDNWNICLDYAKGDFIMCIGDDDMLAATCLEDYKCMIMKYPHVDLFHSRVLQIDENDNPINISLQRAEYETISSFLLHRFCGNLQFIGDFLFKTSKLRDFGGFYKLPLAWGSDDVSAFMVARENGVVHINHPNFYYRVNRYTISQTGDIRIKLKAIELLRKWYDEFLPTIRTEDFSDQLTFQNIEKMLERVFIKKYAYVIAKDISRNLFNLVKWKMEANRYNLKDAVLFLGLLEALKLRKK